jgi:hypothetical protein
LYELAGDWGLEPDRLLSFTLREIYQYAKGVRKRRSIEENHIRKFAYLFAQANRDPQKYFPKVNEFWPIPYLDQKNLSFADTDKNTEIKTKYLNAWQLLAN